ncbi:hypothetical protein DpV83gp065 [Deerpox virus W-848-83]|uniref:Protein OPG091 n=1 Tax=Deerpox virus (strain Mule deer/United States/W-848-83/1983) TaxID=305674 RepID=Q08FT7_DPV83|nr:hypothetical protein DpV83gp065 [Deerpox virus W-848-83]ABI99220.1 hypothetical protein DpV83gp065 [Deerpox virus W-848-83]
MDPITFIKFNVPKGAIIFINYRFSLTEHFNPSEDKHAAIYLGKIKKENLISCKRSFDENEVWAIEASYKNGVNLITLDELLKGALNIKIFILDDELSEPKMSIAADISLKFIGMPYGFGSNHIYCFKLVAESYSYLGITMPTYNILGKKIYLSQSFTHSGHWKKIYES